MYLSLYQNVLISLILFGADYFISFHINSGGGTGFESYIYNGLSNSSSAYAKQQKIHAAVNPVLTKYGLRDRGAKKQIMQY